MAEDDEARARRERRAWIAANHPDRGGDPHTFDDGLRRLTPTRSGPDHPPRVTVYRSRSPWRRLRRLVRRMQQPKARRARRLL